MRKQTKDRSDWRPPGPAPVDPRGPSYRSCSDPNCPRCRRNRWIRRLTLGFGGYGG
ncbi:MAG TPA: hypothetical protein VFW71_12055 [Actinomycetota bacterium]|nr:hypothetical protein [Actinomycetota bacterium]